jgi:two-component system nitrate/nitrite response regulator NarL
MTPSISIVVIDDHPLLREGVSSTLQAVNGFEVVGEGENYEDAQRIVHQTMPDMILLDISMPGGGVEAARDIHDALPAIKIIMLTASEDEKDVISALQAGANVYILKGIGGRDLVDIVKKVSSGESFITPGLATNLLLHSYQQSPSQQRRQWEK